MFRIACALSLIALAWGCGTNELNEPALDQASEGFDLGQDKARTQSLGTCSLEMVWWKEGWQIHTSEAFGLQHNPQSMMVPDSWEMHAPSSVYDVSTGELRQQLTGPVRLSKSVSVQGSPYDPFSSVSIHSEHEGAPLLHMPTARFALSIVTPMEVKPPLW